MDDPQVMRQVERNDSTGCLSSQIHISIWPCGIGGRIHAFATDVCFDGASRVAYIFVTLVVVVVGEIGFRGYCEALCAKICMQSHRPSFRPSSEVRVQFPLNHVLREMAAPRELFARSRGASICMMSASEGRSCMEKRT